MSFLKFKLTLRIRLLLRAPCLSHPTLGASSTPIVARSLSRILHQYASLAANKLFHPCYAQLRRIITCGQLLVLCHTARELGRHEAEELFAVFLALVKEHIGHFDFVPDLVHSFENVGAFLGESGEEEEEVQESHGVNQHEALVDVGYPGPVRRQR